MVFGQNGKLGIHVQPVVEVVYSGGTGHVRAGHMGENTAQETMKKNRIATNTLVLVTKSRYGLPCPKCPISDRKNGQTI